MNETELQNLSVLSSFATQTVFTETHFCSTIFIWILWTGAAARMEQSGKPGLVHMTSAAATLFFKEEGKEDMSPPLHLTKIKSKGSILTAWYAF